MDSLLMTLLPGNPATIECQQRPQICYRACRSLSFDETDFFKLKTPATTTRGMPLLVARKATVELAGLQAGIQRQLVYISQSNDTYILKAQTLAEALTSKGQWTFARYSMGNDTFLLRRSEQGCNDFLAAEYGTSASGNLETVPLMVNIPELDSVSLAGRTKKFQWQMTAAEQGTVVIRPVGSDDIALTCVPDLQYKLVLAPYPASAGDRLQHFIIGS